MKIYGDIEIKGNNTSPVTLNGQPALFDIQTVADNTALQALINTDVQCISGGGDRGLHAGGWAEDLQYQIIDYISISYMQNANDFGNLFHQVNHPASTSNSENDRAVFAGGYIGGSFLVWQIDYCRISTTGDTSFFGSLDDSSSVVDICASSNGLGNIAMFKGSNIRKLNLLTFGDAIEFGEVYGTRQYSPAASNGPLGRAIMAGGYWSAYYNTIQHIQISTFCNAELFGELNSADHCYTQGGSNGCLNRALFPCGRNNNNSIEYINISSFGNGIDFGDLIYPTSQWLMNNTNGVNNDIVFTEGGGSSSKLQSIRINSLGDSIYFGMLSCSRHGCTGVSNAPTSQNPTSGHAVVGHSGFPAGDRGLILGGIQSNVMEAITISTPGNASYIGDLWYPMTVSSVDNTECTAVNGLYGHCLIAKYWAAQYPIMNLNVTLSTTSYNYSNLVVRTERASGGSNGINSRAVFVSGHNSSNIELNNIDYITISSANETCFDFGDLNYARCHHAVVDNAINDRAVTIGGDDFNSINIEIMEFIGISTTGDALPFGTLWVERGNLQGTSNGVYDRGIVAGGYDFVNSGPSYNQIEIISISTTSNTVDFGDLTLTRDCAATLSNGIFNRAVFSGGYDRTSGAVAVNNIDYVNINNKANASTFGELTTARAISGGASNADTGTVRTYDGGSGQSGGTGGFAVDSFFDATGGTGGSGENYTGGTGGTGIYDLELVVNLDDHSLNLFRTSYGNELNYGGQYIKYIQQTPGAQSVFAGGEYIRTYLGSMEYSTFLHESTVKTFGELSVFRSLISGVSNSTLNKGIFISGYMSVSPHYTRVMDYITIDTKSDAQFFGNLTFTFSKTSSTSNDNNDRGVIGGGFGVAGSITSNVIEYITISTSSDALDFGDLITTRFNLSACSNGESDRAVFAGGNGFDYIVVHNVIEYVTISTTSNALNFGDLLDTLTNQAATDIGSGNRGFFSAGSTFPNTVILENVSYLTISTLGNALSFSDLIFSRQNHTATSNGIGGRMFFGGGYDGPLNNSPLTMNTIELKGFFPHSDAYIFCELDQSRTSLGSVANG